MTLDLDEISDGEIFQDLVVAYFEELKEKTNNEIIDVTIKPSGIGVDGGRDILVSIKIFDGVTMFERRWVIQCKFHDRNISTSEIADINIPTLLYSYKASGYLLVCKQRPTSKLTDLFERLEAECIFGNKYMVWSGDHLKKWVLTSKEEIIKLYFPKYYNFINK